MAHSSNPDALSFRQSLGGQSDAVVADTQLNLVVTPPQNDLHVLGARMTVHIHECFLGDPKERHARTLVKRRCVEIAVEGRSNSGPAFEPANQGSERLAEISLAKFGRVMKKRERPELLIDLVDGVRDFLDQGVVDRRRLQDAKTREPKLQGHKKLAGRIMQFLAEPLTLIFMDLQEFVEVLRRRRTSRIHGPITRLRFRGAAGAGRRFERLQFDMVAHTTRTPGATLENDVANY